MGELHQTRSKWALTQTDLPNLPSRFALKVTYIAGAILRPFFAQPAAAMRVSFVVQPPRFALLA